MTETPETENEETVHIVHQNEDGNFIFLNMEAYWKAIQNYPSNNVISIKKSTRKRAKDSRKPKRRQIPKGATG